MSGRLAKQGDPDIHPWDQCMVVIRGRLEVTLGEGDDAKTYEVGPDDVVYIPGNVPHIGRVIGDEDAFAVEIFAPVREDYLDMAEHQLALEND